VVMEMSRSFDAYWNSELAVPVGAFLDTPPGAGQVELALSRMAAHAERFHATEYARALRATGIGPQVREGRFPLVPARAAVYDTFPPAAADAAEQSRPVATTMRRLVEGAQHEVMLISPYFIPSARGADLLCSLVKQGVRVRVLTNSLASTDVPVAHAGYARYRPRLLACGVSLYEMRPNAAHSGSARPGLSSGASLHAKAVVVDGKSVLIGSMNLDPRSRRSNTEIAVLIESAVLGEQIGTLFEEASSPEQAFHVELTKHGNPKASLVWGGRENGKAVRYSSEPLASAWRRMASKLLGALAPEELL